MTKNSDPDPATWGVDRQTWWRITGRRQLLRTAPALLALAALAVSVGLIVAVAIHRRDPFLAIWAMVSTGLLLFVLRAVSVAFWKGARDAMDYAGPLAVELLPDAVAVTGPSSARHYSGDAVRVGDHGQWVVLGLDSWNPDLLPSSQISADSLREHLARLEPMPAGGDFDRHPGRAPHLGMQPIPDPGPLPFVAGMIPVAAIGVLLMANGVQQAVLLVALAAVFAAMNTIVPVASRLGRAADPLAGTRWSMGDDGVTVRLPGYRELLPWRVVSRIRGRGTALEITICMAPISLVGTEADVREACQVALRSGCRNVRLRGTPGRPEIAAWTVMIAASVALLLVAVVDPQRLGPWGAWAARAAVGPAIFGGVWGVAWITAITGSMAVLARVSVVGGRRGSRER